MHNLVFAIFLKKQYRYISVSFLIFFPLSFLQEKIQEPIIVLTMISSLREPIIVLTMISCLIFSCRKDTGTNNCFNHEQYKRKIE